MNKEVENKIKKFIKEELKKEARQEAISILKLANDEEINKFLLYYERDIINVCCIIIDEIKIRLVKEGILEMKENDNFGYEYFKI